MQRVCTPSRLIFSSSTLLVKLFLVQFVFSVFVNSIRMHSHLSADKFREYSQLLRPVPSKNDLPLPIQENPDRKYDPPIHELDPVRLKQLLGPHFDSQFMSISMPKERLKYPNGTMSPGFRLKKGHLVPAGRMPKWIQRLRLKSVNFPASLGGVDISSNQDRKTLRKQKQLLWAYTYCPVLYQWKDLGTRFWPRWLRSGVCYDQRSCSIPKGMRCHPRKNTTKHLLRWFCNSYDKRRGCRWVQVEYPVLIQCGCGC